MSKAFTRESDDVMEPAPRPAPSALPPGAKNYFTPQGWAKLHRELEQLAAAPASPPVRLRILEIQQSLQTAVPVPPPSPPWNQVLFGATVTVRSAQGEHLRYRIVGVDETDLDRNHVGWLSPVARALLKRRVGERVRVRTPAGEQDLEITGVEYEP